MVFNGANATSTPIIAEMAMKKGIAASILSASTKSIGDKAYGNMLLGIEDKDETVNEALNYLSQLENVIAQEVSKG